MVFPTKKASEFLETPRLHSQRSAASKKSPDISTGEGTMEAHHKSLFTKYLASPCTWNFVNEGHAFLKFSNLQFSQLSVVLCVVLSNLDCIVMGQVSFQKIIGVNYICIYAVWGIQRYFEDYYYRYAWYPTLSRVLKHHHWLGTLCLSYIEEL